MWCLFSSYVVTDTISYGRQLTECPRCYSFHEIRRLIPGGSMNSLGFMLVNVIMEFAVV